MGSYVEFVTAGGGKMLVEVSSADTSARHGVVKAGAGNKIRRAAALTSSLFEEAIRDVVRTNAEALVTAIGDLANPPTESVVSFGIKADGEVGGFGVARIGGEATYTITLTWRKRDS